MVINIQFQIRCNAQVRDFINENELLLYLFKLNTGKFYCNDITYNEHILDHK
jgi:hypothetical protein